MSYYCHNVILYIIHLVALAKSLQIVNLLEKSVKNDKRQQTLNFSLSAPATQPGRDKCAPASQRCALRSYQCTTVRRQLSSGLRTVVHW